MMIQRIILERVNTQPFRMIFTVNTHRYLFRKKDKPYLICLS